MSQGNFPVRSLGIRSVCAHLLSILSVAILVALSPRGATAAGCTGTTDAQQPLNPDLVELVYDELINNTTNNTHGVAQVFTAQHSGILQGVTLHLERFMVANITPRFYLWTTALGVPVSSPTTVLASKVIFPDFAVGQSAGPKDVCVVLSVPVVAGTMYAFGIVAGGTQSTFPPTRGLNVYGKSGNPYPGKTYNFDGPNALSNGDDFGNFQERLDDKDIKFVFYIEEQEQDHFLCYDLSQVGPGPQIGVTLLDQFWQFQAGVLPPVRLCAPANKNGEDPGAPTHPDHLVSYPIDPAQSFTPVLNVKVVNQFGTLFVDVIEPVRLLVPSAKSLSNPAVPEPETPTVDHFTCYSVKALMTAEDQFGPHALKNGVFGTPTMLCAPTNKQNQSPGAQNHAGHLMCYKVDPVPPPVNLSPVFANNQFGPVHLPVGARIRGPKELCVPSIKIP